MNELGDEEDMDAFFASGVHGGSEVGINAKTPIEHMANLI